MDRLSRVSLWTLVGAALTGAGCADILGFKDFSNDADGSASGEPGTSQEQTSGTANGGTSNQNGGGGTTATGGSTGGTGGANSGTGGSNNGGTGGTTGNTGGSTGSTGTTGGGTGGGSSETSSGGGTGGGGGGSSSSKSSTGASSGSGTAASSSSSLPTSSGPPPACTYSSVPEPGGGTTSGATSGTATEYYFGQCSGCFVGSTYKTACGYAGTEPTANGFNSVDVVPNAASLSPASDMYFAAIPGASSPDSNPTDYTTFNTVGACGACVELSANGKTIVATVIDECPISSNPHCSEGGHLDLSTTAFGALGFNQSGGGDPSGLSWQFVACPVSGDIQASLNSPAQVYFQNTAYPITSVSVNGQAATLTIYGYWQLPTNASGATVTLTDVEGDTVTVMLPTIATWPASTSIGIQFQQATGCE